MTIYYEMNEDFLMHFGVPGMKWGHRKQRISGSDGIRRGSAKKNKQHSSDTQGDRRKQNIKKAAKVGAAVVGTALAAYGGYKLHKFINTKSGQIQREKGNAVYNKIMESFKNVDVKNVNGKRVVTATSKRSKGVWDIDDFNKKIARTINEENEKVINQAINASRNVRNKQMNFRQKTANVAKYYINKKKKK